MYIDAIDRSALLCRQLPMMQGMGKVYTAALLLATVYCMVRTCSETLFLQSLYYDSCYMHVMQIASGTGALLITPANVRYVASFIHSSATVNESSICIGTGLSNERLLTVPIASAAELDVHTSIKVTVGQNPTGPNTRDHDPHFGITDGVNTNRFSTWDADNYPTYPPCRPENAIHEDRRISSGIRAPAQYTFLFTPFNRFGACYTAQNEGYTNSGQFNTQLAVTRGLSFHVDRHGGTETYCFHYFLIEFL